MSQRKFKRAQQKTKKCSGKEAQQVPERQPSVQAMVWYREEDWETLIAMFADAEMLPRTYEAWLERAHEMQEKVQAEGDAVIKVYIDPETFPKWCKEKDLPMNAEARAQLAIEVAQTQTFSL